ncbi:MAG: Nif3-like dinuclear metal center hexameric protein [Clostridia bacterium]|nr:Nif3-like dinuclear metal center hexameric protein [Clostridia bacterium]
MTVNDIYTYLDDKYNFSSALSYDNVGHLVGSLNSTVTGIVVCLDCTDEAVSMAVEQGANLIVSHHPVIFDPLKSVTDESLVYRLIRNDISVISVHTNLDQADGGVNDALCSAIDLVNVEKVTDSEGFFYRIGELEEPMSAEVFANFVAEKLKLRVKYVGENNSVKRVAVCSGSGGSMLFEVAGTGVDAFVTADVKHDVFLDAHALGMVLLDAGHFETEDIIVAPLANELKTAFPKVNVAENHFTPIKYTK